MLKKVDRWEDLRPQDKALILAWGKHQKNYVGCSNSVSCTDCICSIKMIGDEPCWQTAKYWYEQYLKIQAEIEAVLLGNEND